MSDSSEDEDLSRFRDAVDTTFTKLIHESRGKISTVQKQKPRSERYLDVATHYNDIKVPVEIQKRIGAKISDIIHKNIEFVEVIDKCFKKRKVKGGVKLFGDSVDFLSCEDDKDLLTCIHNKKSKEIKNANVRRKIDDVEELNEKDKISAVVVNGETVLEGEKSWRSRRKQKIFEYKLIGKNQNKLIIEDKNS
ncbi:uncharacterized protein LOC123663768 [Melitaea cinxia]|uniref:uncharacterized protein LOC123663768 n=1 Tax=Melitaea cinxia TaxID=113334 RepID=UPI001E26F873|nr:uncharacterized protein LOC123663768 [Melitaea cinxia]